MYTVVTEDFSVQVTFEQSPDETRKVEKIWGKAEG